MISFVGAGPGAPDLITVRGMRLLESADLIIYAGSLVNPDLLFYAKKNCTVLNSACMTLREVLDAMFRAEQEGKHTVRLHTGDPSIYGAIREQMDALEKAGISYQVVPGVSSFCGAAAALRAEYTLPGVSQTVILTRMAGRTPVPETEEIATLAAHQATMIIFLSTGMLPALTERLLAGGYPPDTPAALVYKATWDDEKIVRGALKELANLAQEHGITKTALVLIGRFLGDHYERSCLYDPGFSHGFRDADEGVR